jgi:transposase
MRWRKLAKHFPPSETVYERFRHFVRLMLFCAIHTASRFFGIDRNAAPNWRGALVLTPR